jgi:hexosaminidase
MWCASRGNQPTTFYEKVVDEIGKMYKEAGLKMDTFHTGGDEVAEGTWTKSPMIDKLLKEHPELKGPRKFADYFFRELLPRLEKRNLKVHGWEEVALTKTPAGAYLSNPEFVGHRFIHISGTTCMMSTWATGWRMTGYQVILCNVTNFYFDMSYDNDPKEPGLYWADLLAHAICGLSRPTTCLPPLRKLRWANR